MNALRATDPTQASFASRATRAVLRGGWISPREVVRHGIVATDVSQSHAVALVHAGNGRGYAVKSSRGEPESAPEGEPESGCGGQGSPERERRLYDLASHDATLAGLVPSWIGEDPDEACFVFEALTTSRRLDRHRDGRGVVDAEVAREFGRVLAKLHSLSIDGCGLERSPAWVLSLGRSDQLAIFDRDAALARVVERVVADPDLDAALARVRDLWRDEALVHGDVRFSNTMVSSTPFAIRLIDWETAGVGDPAWDIGSAIQEYLSTALHAGHAAELTPAIAPIRALLDGYGTPDRAHLGPFVAARVVMRAIQLRHWGGDVDESIELHLDLARRVAARGLDFLGESRGN